ncbi:ShlB/FhaC/HecB family hemolysin secretion/activation protein [Herbaspirillum sp. YR522]|uniref:ShlB/FhaC/HecB family hemolysin secretion/activation protein n=1 Tax=Herbaspirillum sp. YR522 TaxID=1144342 RepID=UPI00026F7F8B|nr:ShlB/FhaC/HecB family hemolysin secretion/activation protein [Herbaspirillum sp. YR522]EJN03237.1 hemolysin activation/secretion protein [Herbaspirillum sp. YR522]
MTIADLLPSFPKTTLAALLLAALEAHAAGPVVTPDAGAILQQLQPSVPPTPQSGRPALQIEPKNATGGPATAPFEVREIRITGNTEFATDVLHALVADQQARQRTLAQLEEAAARITDFYQRHGFPLARALIPAQTISAGVVVIQVVEARYGRIDVDNRSEVSDALVQATAASLQPGQVIDERHLDRTLLLLSDIPGVGVNAVLKPGAAVGTSDLALELARAPVALANAALDNYGNRYVGRMRASGNLNLVNPFHHGDVLSLSAVSSGEGMQFARLGYDTLINGLGTHAGVAYSFVHYRLGGSVDALGAHGTAGVASAWLRQPLLRSRQANIYAQAQLDAKQLRDSIDAGGTHTDRHLDNWVLSLNGDRRDSILAGGISIWSLGWTIGRVDFDDTAAQTADAASARTRGSFSKWNLNFSRLQALGNRDIVYFNAALQWSDGNLDSAEKMTVGGPYTVRAYDIGAVSGDTGAYGTLEWRHDLGLSMPGKLQTVAFIDSARVRINRHPWSSGENSVSLSGIGAGLNWDGPDSWKAALSVATSIGAHPSTVAAPASARAWLTLGKTF